MNPKLHWLFRRFRAPEDGTGSADGGGGAPAAEPAEPASASDDSVDWGDLNSDADPGEDDEEGEGADPSPDDPSTAAAAPTPASPTQPATPGQPQAQPVVEPIPGQPAVAATETPEQIAAAETKVQEDYAKWRGAELTRLEGAYKISDDDAARILTEPELVLPKMAAQIHMQAVEQTLAAVQRLIPQMVPQVVQRSDTEAKAEKFFYDKNPDLKSHHAQVMQAGKFFRQMNPKATPEEAATKIGELVRSSMGLPPLQAATEGKAGKPAAGKPAPHRPVAAGGGRAPARPAQGDTTWSDMLDGDDD